MAASRISRKGWLSLLAVLTGLLVASAARADDIKTNSVHMANPPKWLTDSHVDRVVEQIQSKMEWDIHRVEVTWYYDNASFAKANPLGAGAIALTKHVDTSVHLGPKVTEANFDQVFGHEMVHVISLQKYRGAIPGWLEEGLANYFSKNGKVDYKWLAAQPPVADVKELTHPFSGAPSRVTYVYAASQALAEMIASHCDMSDLLRMSVGRKLENYLSKTCNIDDLNGSFKAWVAKNAAKN